MDVYFRSYYKQQQAKSMDLESPESRSVPSVQRDVIDPDNMVVNAANLNTMYVVKFYFLF